MLIAHYRLNNSIQDIKLNYDSKEHGNISYVDGLAGDCANFTGQAFSTNIPNLQKFSISFWVNFDSISDDWIISKQSSSTNYSNGWLIRIDTPSNKLSYRLGYGSGQESITHEIQTSRWYNIVTTFDGHVGKLYIDNTLIGQTNYITDGIDYTGVDDVYIGGAVDLTRFLNGKMWGVRIYDHELSQLEINELYKLNVISYKFAKEESTVNLFNDPDFDDSAVWSASKFYSSGGVDGGAYCGDTSTWGFKQTINVEAGYRYAVSGYVRMPSNSTTVRIALRNADMGNKYVNTGGEWTYFEDISGVVDTTGPNPIYILDSSKSGNEVQADKFQIEKREFVTPFVNGSRTGIIYDSSNNNIYSNLDDNSPAWSSNSITGQGSFYFNGSNYIKTKETLYLSKGAGTLCWWMKPDVNENMTLFIDNIGSYRSMIETRTNNMYGETNSNCNHIDSPSIIQKTSWNHYAIVFENNKAFWYENSILIGEVENYGRIDCDVSTDKLEDDLIINYIGGNSAYNNGFKGYMTDIRLFRKALTQPEIQEIHDLKTKLRVDNKNSVWTYLSSSSTTTKLYNNGHLEYGPKFNKNIIEGL